MNFLTTVKYFMVLNYFGKIAKWSARFTFFDYSLLQNDDMITLICMAFAYFFAP